MSRGKRATVTLDEVSKAIIEQLQQDGRRSYAAIGKVVGLSEAAVRQRVQRLTESGVMQVVAVTDPLQLGFAPDQSGLHRASLRAPRAPVGEVRHAGREVRHEARESAAGPRMAGRRGGRSVGAILNPTPQECHRCSST